MKYKLRKDLNLAELLKDAQKCAHDVYLSTPEGDVLNLKSTLSQYVVVVLADKEEILRASELSCDPSDKEKMAYYIDEE
ncbi:MAG: hypothetical protein ACOYA9_08305 [Bilifractor sp.]|jgi:hypothetical protein